MEPKGLRAVLDSSPYDCQRKTPGIDPLLGRAFLVQRDEIPKGHREGICEFEGVNTQSVFEARDDQRQTQRIESRVKQLQIIG